MIDIRTVANICFRRGLADARINLFPGVRNWFSTGISSGNGTRGGPAGLDGRAPCCDVGVSEVDGVLPGANWILPSAIL